MDFTAKVGTDFATGDGIVAQADNRASGYGNHILRGMVMDTKPYMAI
jgi:murein DD-endopeptidase MepM/ murein hydrolase activator NlpD